VIPLIARITSLEAAMMGRQTGDQASLFYEFRLAAGCVQRRLGVLRRFGDQRAAMAVGRGAARPTPLATTS
jgi:hypothetical protein